MATFNKIKEVFDYYNIKSGVDSEYGNWVVSKDADVVNVERLYPIFTHQIESESVESWLEHLFEKTWFNTEEETNFRKAYKRAEELLGS